MISKISLIKQIHVLNNFFKTNNYMKNLDLKRWKDTTALEMKRFFAVVIAMGIITLLDISGP